MKVWGAHLPNTHQVPFNATAGVGVHDNARIAIRHRVLDMINSATQKQYKAGNADTNTGMAPGPILASALLSALALGLVYLDIWK